MQTHEDLPTPERLVIIRPSRQNSQHPRDQQGELPVRVIFEIDESYDLRVGEKGTGEKTDRHLFVPAGTRLVGTSTHIQPLFHTYHLFGGITDWRIPTEEVTFTYLADEIMEEGVHEDFAQECIDLAELHAHPGGHQVAQRHFGRAIVALFTCGAPDLTLADLRVNRALSLLEFGQVDEAIAELEEAANAYEAATDAPRLRRSGKRLQNGERLVQILLLLMYASLQAADEQQVLATEERLLAKYQSTPQHSECNARLLIRAAEYFHRRRDTEQAFPRLEQADFRYSPQIATQLRLMPST